MFNQCSALAGKFFKVPLEFLLICIQYSCEITYLRVDKARQRAFLVEPGHQKGNSELYRAGRGAMTRKLEIEAVLQLSKCRLAKSDNTAGKESRNTAAKEALQFQKHDTTACE